MVQRHKTDIKDATKLGQSPIGARDLSLYS